MKKIEMNNKVKKSNKETLHLKDCDITVEHSAEFDELERNDAPKHTGKRKTASRVFLGGTRADTTWCEEIIKGLKIDYFNPVVKDWTEECIATEEVEKWEKCNLHLYVITSAMKGVYTIAELIDSCHRFKDSVLKNVVFAIIPDGFNAEELRSLEAVASKVKELKGLNVHSLKEALYLLNNLPSGCEYCSDILDLDSLRIIQF